MARNEKDKAYISNFFKAVLALNDESECEAFFDDICTIKELEDLAHRLEVAHLLSSGLVYSKITEETGVSTATISRVNRCINYGPGGYAMVLPRVFDDLSDDKEE